MTARTDAGTQQLFSWQALPSGAWEIRLLEIRKFPLGLRHTLLHSWKTRSPHSHLSYFSPLPAYNYFWSRHRNLLREARCANIFFSSSVHYFFHMLMRLFCDSCSFCHQISKMIEYFKPERSHCFHLFVTLFHATQSSFKKDAGSKS